MFQVRLQPPFNKQTKDYKLITAGLGKPVLIIESDDRIFGESIMVLPYFFYSSLYNCFLATVRCGILG